MPQEHHVLRCVSCETFQVHIVKKTKKWECKICGSKQSVRRNYGRGSGKDCRNQVMKLNELRLSKENASIPIEDDETFDEVFTEKTTEKEPDEKKPFISKWAKYLDESSVNTGNESEEDNPPYCLSETFEKKKKRMKKMSENSGNSKKKYKGLKNNEVSFESFDNANNLFISVKEENFEMNKLKDEDNSKKCFTEIQTEKDNYKKYPIQPKSNYKQSKYAKYLDEDEDNTNETEINKDSNIFSSDLFDIDDILNF